MSAPVTPLQLRPQDVNFMSPGGLDSLNTFLRQVQQGTANGFTLSQNVNASVVTLDFNILPAWQTATLLNGWTQVAGPEAPVGYMKDALGMVWIRGRVTGGTLGAATPVFILPAAYLPEFQMFLTSDNNTPVTFRLEINSSAGPAGGVAIVQGQTAATAGTAWSLVCSFPAKDPSPVANLAAPISFEHKLRGKCTDLLVTSATNTGTSRDMNPPVTPTWADDGQGNVVVSALLGLAPGKGYTVRFLCLGEPN